MFRTGKTLVTSLSSCTCLSTGKPGQSSTSSTLGDERDVGAVGSPGLVPVLDRRGHHAHQQPQPQGVGDDESLAAVDLLARGIAPEPLAYGVGALRALGVDDPAESSPPRPCAVRSQRRKADMICSMTLVPSVGEAPVHASARAGSPRAGAARSSRYAPRTRLRPPRRGGGAFRDGHRCRPVGAVPTQGPQGGVGRSSWHSVMLAAWREQCRGEAPGLLPLLKHDLN